MNQQQENRYQNYDMYGYQPRYYDQNQQYQNGRENQGRHFSPGTIRRIINEFSNSYQEQHQQQQPPYIQPPNYGNNVPNFDSRFSDVNTPKNIDPLSNPAPFEPTFVPSFVPAFNPENIPDSPKIIESQDGEGTFQFPGEDNGNKENIVMAEEPKIEDQTTKLPIPIEVETTTQNGLVHITPNLEARNIFESSPFRN